jgi:hypothetical protein
VRQRCSRRQRRELFFERAAGRERVRGGRWARRRRLTMAMALQIMSLTLSSRNTAITGWIAMIGIMLATATAADLKQVLQRGLHLVRDVGGLLRFCCGAEASNTSLESTGSILGCDKTRASPKLLSVLGGGADLLGESECWELWVAFISFV